MALVRWDPWQEMLAFQREAQEMFRRVLGEGWGARSSALRTVWTPAIEMFERDGDLVVQAELPGIDPEKDVEISVTDNVLTIRGERHREERDEGNGYYRSEALYGRFERQVLLPETVKVDDIRASYDKGVLEVVVPKAVRKPATRKIAVQTGPLRKALTARGRRK